MQITEGQLERSQMVTDYGQVLSDLLDDELTGYSRIESGDSVVFETDGAGILTFESGVPVAAYHTADGMTGEAALEELSKIGPFYIEVYTVEATVLSSVHETAAVRVPPERPAEQLAGDPALAERTRAAASSDQLSRGRETDGEALLAFLNDEDRIEEIRQEAKEQAKQRAEQWNLHTELTEE